MSNINKRKMAMQLTIHLHFYSSILNLLNESYLKRVIICFFIVIQ